MWSRYFFFNKVVLQLITLKRRKRQSIYVKQSVVRPVRTLPGATGASNLAGTCVLQKDRGKKFGQALGPRWGLKSHQRLTGALYDLYIEKKFLRRIPLSTPEIVHRSREKSLKRSKLTSRKSLYILIVFYMKNRGSFSKKYFMVLTLCTSDSILERPAGVKKKSVSSKGKLWKTVKLTTPNSLCKHCKFVKNDAHFQNTF